MENRIRDCVMVVGSGMMGSGIGAMSALAGNRTVLIDTDEKKAQSGKEKAIQCIEVREKNGLNSREEAAAAVQLLEVGTDINVVANQAFLVIEAIVEHLETKQKLFEELDSILPAEVPICSNTSGLRITDIADRCNHPERTVTTHFWLPAHLVPLVEVVMGGRTNERVAIEVVEKLKGWQKAPVLVKRDLPGQLANRVFQAIIRESIAIVASGLASAEDVDTAISCGMAMRFPVWGPLKHLDAIGLELGLAVQETVLPDISCEQQANQFLKALVAEGRLGAKTGSGFYDWRQRNINIDMDKRDAFIIEAVKVTQQLNR